MVLQCNSLFARAGKSASNFDKLQRVQNTLARVVLRRDKYDLISSALVEPRTGHQSSNVLHSKSRLLLSTLSEKIYHPTCAIFCVTMRHRAVCVRPLRIFHVPIVAKLLSAHVRSDLSPLTHGTACLIQFAIVTVCVLLNLNLTRTYLHTLCIDCTH